MAKWFRSEPMEYISMIMNEDAAHDCLADLGNLGVIQFTDVSSNTALSLYIYIYRHVCMMLTCFALKKKTVES